jgi:hypothetical protein
VELGGGEVRERRGMWGSGGTGRGVGRGAECVAAMGQGETVGSGKLTMQRRQAKSSLCKFVTLHKVDD